MHRKFISLMIIVLLLAGCTQITPPPATDAIPNTTAAAIADTTEVTVTEEPTQVTETTEVTETEETTVETTEETTEPPETTADTEPAHSDLYISYVTPGEMVQYFNEVCLDAEYIYGGDASKLQRWENPIYYSIYGDPTDKDLQVLVDMAQWLNTVEGFPGIYEAEAEWQTNLSIYFCSQQELVDRMGEQHYGNDGAVTFWYTDNIIYDEIICIRSDLDQTLRNSVILEEIYNGLGPVQDTDLRSESIIYSGFSQPQALHPIDRVIIQLLYHPSLSCGMDAAECEEAILALYY